MEISERPLLADSCLPFITSSMSAFSIKRTLELIVLERLLSSVSGHKEVY